MQEITASSTPPASPLQPAWAANIIIGFARLDGTGDLDEAKTLGFSAIRVKVDAEGNAPKEQIDEIIAHSNVWSPVANTLRNNVALDVTPA